MPVQLEQGRENIGARVTFMDAIKALLPDFAKDIRLNLTSLLANDSALSAIQRYGVACAVAYATRHALLIEAIEGVATEFVDEGTRTAAKGAASIMAMNNVYYRSMSQITSSNYLTLQAGLRMQFLAKHGIETTTFELFSLAVSAYNGCGHCVDAHVHTLTKAGLDKAQIQQAIQLAAVIAGAAQAAALV